MPVPRRVVLGGLVTAVTVGIGAAVSERHRPARPARRPVPPALRPLVAAALGREQGLLEACRQYPGDPRATALAGHHEAHVRLLTGARPTPTPSSSPLAPPPVAAPAVAVAARRALAAREESLAAGHLADLARADADLAAYLASMAACAVAGAADLRRPGP